MDVTTNNQRALISQKMSIELLLADMPETEYTRNSSSISAKKLDIGKPRFKSRAARGGPLAPGHGGASRRLHPVQALRARLP